MQCLAEKASSKLKVRGGLRVAPLSPAHKIHSRLPPLTNSSSISSSTSTIKDASENARIVHAPIVNHINSYDLPNSLKGKAIPAPDVVSVSMNNNTMSSLSDSVFF